MKKFGSLLLTFCLLFQSFAPTVLALTETGAVQKGIEPSTEIKTAEVENDVQEKKGENEELETVEETLPETDLENVVGTLPTAKQMSPKVAENFEGNGSLEVDIKFNLPMTNVENPNIGMNIIDQNGNTVKVNFNGITTMQNIPYTLGDQNGNLTVRKLNKEGSIINGVDGKSVMYYAVTLYNVKQGSYSIELYGNGYKTYKVSNVVIKDYSKRVSISNETGLFEVGDINRDSIVTEADIDALIPYMDSVDTNTISLYDLNRDGKIDIADLALIASTIHGTVQKVNMINTNAIINSSSVVTEGIIEGSVKDLFTDTGSVKVKPASENSSISELNAATIAFDMNKAVEMSQIRLEAGTDNVPEEMDVLVTDENGITKTIHKSFAENKSFHYFTDKATANTIIIDLQGQIAVKKVTIKITKTSSKNLAEIAKVEFLNNVYEEVPVPVIEIPKNVQVKLDSEQATVTFGEMANVTGYEILLEQINEGVVVENTVYQTNYNTFTIKDLKNYTNYKVSVRAVNQEWKGNYSASIDFSPIPTSLPPSVDMVQAEGVYAGININYKKMSDTLTYNIYYRIVGTNEYTKIKNISGTSYQLRGLKSEVEYQLYVTGNNDLGEGSSSQIAKAKTKGWVLADTTNYKLLNTANGVGTPTSHIQNVKYQGNKYNAGEFALVDNNFESYWQSDSWDTGGYNELNAGPIFTFDGTYKIDQINFVAKDDNASFFYTKINYWDATNQRQRMNAGIQRKTSPNGQIYYHITFDKAVETNKIQLNLANYQAVGNNAMREVKFYMYDSLEDEVASLFIDDLRVELNENVTEKIINDLETRTNTKDSISGEYHPNRKVILSDLEYAKKILKDIALQNTILVDQSVSNSRNSHLGFAMSISDLQPLGIAAKAGDKIIIYVGAKGNQIPQLVFTQYNAEASVWKQNVINLKKGQNIIDVPKIGSMNTERGGSVYIRYPYASATEQPIKVRVSGGTKIPTLDIHNASSEEEIKILIETYIEELEVYTSNLPSIYNVAGQVFDTQTSILNVTEIVTKNGLFSVAATAANNGIKAGLTTTISKEDRLYQSLISFEEMMNLFYRQKGLLEDPLNPKDMLPSSRINIRQMRMFDGSFMYAGGEHIGIGYSSVAGLMQGRPNVVNGNDITTSGYFGWGISHEIGHQINQGNFVSAEVTNNVYSLLAETNDDKSSARIENLYDDIYKKVTSNTTGKSFNVFVSLGMYWQLHLAYDNNRTFEDTNSIFARIDHLSRTTDLKGSSDDLFVMYASEAAGKDLTNFFEKWGITISENAKTYIAKFPKEEKNIQYLNDEARRYRLHGGLSMDKSTQVNATIKEADSQNKRFTLNFSVDKNEDTILGYEIKRNGQTIMFTEDASFTDNIGSMNNRALIYEVTAYDKYLNSTSTFTLPEVKVTHDGSIKKDSFEISSNVKMEDDEIDYENPNMDFSKLSVNKLIDGKDETYFNGTTKISEKDKSDANVIINLNAKIDIAGIKYKAMVEDGKLAKNTISKYKVYVSKDRENWILTKTGTMNLNNDNNYTDTLYFDKQGTTGGDQLWTYENISYVKIEADGNKNGISGSEIDVLAPPGDNIDASSETVGVLKKDYHYKDSEGKDAVIQKGSVIFKGDYRGNPAFNVILLVDAENDQTVFEGDNFLFAKLSSSAEVNEISKGYWFYALTKEQYQMMYGKNIRAELYRVNDALSNEGQRLTSTSLTLTKIPAYETLKAMEIIDTTKGE